MSTYRIWIRFAASALLVSWLATPALAQHGGGHAGGGGGGVGGGGGMGGHSGGGAGRSAESASAGQATANPSGNRAAPPRGASSPRAATPATPGTAPAKNTWTSAYKPAAGMHLVPGTPTYRWQDPPSNNAAVGPVSGRGISSPRTFSTAAGTGLGGVHQYFVPGRYPINGGCGRGGCIGYNPYYPIGYGGYGIGYGFGYGFGLGYGVGYGFGFGCNMFSLWDFGCGSELGFGYGYSGAYGYGYGNGLGYYDSGLGYGDSPTNTSSGGYGPYATLDAKTNQPGTLPNPANETTLVLKDGTIYTVSDYWMAAGKLHYVTAENGENTIDIDQVDLQRTAERNSERGVTFTLRTQDAAQSAPSPAADPTPAPAQEPSQAPQPSAEPPRP